MNNELIEAMARAAEGLMHVNDYGQWCIHANSGPSNIARAALAAAEAAGYRLVPVEPTQYMEREGARVSELSAPEAADVYRAMLAAAPEIGRD